MVDNVHLLHGRKPIAGAGSYAVAGTSVTLTLSGGDIIPAERRTDWTYTGVPGGIPARTTVHATFSSGATAAAITAALGAAPAESVVVLNAGTYSSASLGGKIDLNGINDVTLRGAGMGATILQGSNIIGNAADPNSADGRAITGAVKDGFTFTVASATGLSIGRLIEITRNNDTSLIPASFSTSQDMTQINVITNISGLTITCRNPWFYDFSVGSPTIKSINAVGGAFSRVGIEDLTLDYGVASAVGQLWSHDSCWIKNVESVGGTGYHFVILSSCNFEARGCYIHDGGLGPNNAGINMYGDYSFGGTGNSHWRIEDCIFKNMFPAIEVNLSSSGGYVGYNYVPGGNTGVSWSFDDGHAPYNMMNLYEGNDSDTWGADGYFGGAGLGTVFRNYLRGYNVIDASTGMAVRLLRLGYKYNIVGNVLGSAEQNPVDYSGCGDDIIYSLGYPNIGNCSLTDSTGAPWTPDTGGGVYPDANVEATLMRWGNYDYFNDATRFETSELGGVATPSETLPASMIYESEPSWWDGGIPWPPIGPDITGGDGDDAGHVNKIPARVRYEAL